MAGITDTKFRFTPIAFDYGALNSIYTLGARPGSALHAEILKNGALKDLLKQAQVGIDPPWALPTLPKTDDEIVNSVLSAKPLFDPNDPELSRSDVGDNFKRLFTAYKALTRLQELTDFAFNDKRADALRPALDRQFQSFMGQIRDYVDALSIDGINLLSGVRQTSVASSLSFGASNLSDIHYGASVVDVRDNAVAGLTGTETFTVRVNKSDGTPTDVAVDLANVTGTLNLDNIVAEINAQLTATGVATQFAVERYDEFSYGVRIELGTDETVELTAGPGTDAKAVYVAGSAGAGSVGSGFLVKLDDVDGAATQSFYKAINTTDALDRAAATAVDSEGNVYVVGTTGGNLGGELNSAGGNDVFLQKYDAAGQPVFTRLLGSAADASGFAVAVDADNNVFVAGQVSGPLAANAAGGGYDAFVTKFDSTGEEKFTRQIGPFADDAATSLAVDSNGNVFVAGFARGSVGGEAYGGGSDAVLTKLDNDGVLVFNTQFGDAGNESANALTVDSSGNVYVVGTDDGNGFLRKYDGSGTSASLTYSVDLGAIGEGGVTGVALDSAGDVLVVGSTTNAALAGTVVNAHSGGTDAFVLKVDDQGGSASTNYVTYAGTGSSEAAYGIAVDAATDAYYLTGATSGAFAGQTLTGTQDAFVAKFDAAGNFDYARQFGGAFEHSGASIVFDADGTNVLTRLGLPSGAVPPADGDSVVALTSARADQFFYVAVDGGTKRKVTVAADDTLSFLASKIKGALGVAGTATYRDDVGKRSLAITALNGKQVEVFAGSAGFDALAPLGLRKGRLFGEFIDDAANEKAKQSLFELGLLKSLSLRDKKQSEDADIVVQAAQGEIRKAFRFLTEGPEPEPVPQGKVPESLRKQVASLQSALDRIQSFGTPQFSSQGGLFSLLV